MKSLIKSERGSVLILTALTMVVLIAFTALVIDGGYLFYKRTRLQDVADAMALASVVELVEASGGANNKKKKAFERAEKYAGMNGLAVTSSNNNTYTGETTYVGDPGKIVVQFPGDNLNKVKVNLNVTTSLYLAQVLGFNSTTVAVSSTAIMGYADKITGNLLPIGILGTMTDGIIDNDYPLIPKSLTFGPGGGVSGSYGWLAFSNNVPDIIKYLEEGYPGTYKVGDSMYAKPGLVGNPYGSAINDRITADCTFDINTINSYIFPATYPGEELTEEQLAALSGIQLHNQNIINSHLELHESVGANCPRLVYLPVVNGLNQNNPPNTIIGFAKFFILGYDTNSSTLKGIYIPDVVDEANIIPSSVGTVYAPPRLIE